ncbi:MAG: MoxR family ATPase [Verrucomicrobia bacterium]|nr:MoxR family ATPase [Verrucomicrobiota bacterium]MDA1068159.1 MoxR family ATPase [Verrucomicrobiota bacterium]
MSNSVLELTEKIKAASAWVAPLRSTIGQVIIGQQYLVDRLILGLISNGHVLLEGVPGLAKTLSVRTLACAINANFKRIQFTPDLLPADIIGTLIYNPKEHTFETKKGPVFANLVLADEINRAPAKVQSALLEAMQERQVTIGDETHLLPKPFLVLATENPIDQEGTYTLPEAQVDRFMLKLSVGYPSKAEERAILDRMATTSVMEDVKPVISLEDILNARKVVNEVYVDDKIKNYIVDIVFATRYPKDYKLESDSLIQFGASPRATISLTLASKGWAFLQGRGYVTPQDVKTIAMDVLRHRVIVSYEAEAEGKTSEDIVQQILDTLPVP